MLKIGLTGGVACGKSTVCKIFSELGIAVIDADDIARELVEVGKPCYLDIIDTFGAAFLLKNQQLDRAKLRQLIFSDRVAKLQLETILHPRIHRELIERSYKVESAYCILAVPLLIETNMETAVDRILIIDITEKNQLDRLCKRDHIAPTLANNMIHQQSHRSQRLAMADDVIANNTGLQKLENSIKLLHETYLKIAT
jgi:dephospho-CoA kinase|tara:strand:+ start:309 stop:902 length:594 start_codon:yes stop_codon:yes gene_type:complete